MAALGLESHKESRWYAVCVTHKVAELARDTGEAGLKEAHGIVNRHYFDKNYQDRTLVVREDLLYLFPMLVMAGLPRG
jgi:hypothetical protein